MKDMSGFAKIYVALDSVDFRKKANGLLFIIKEKLELQPFDSKCLFVFTNRSRSAIRFLYWDVTGFAVWSKLLEFALDHADGFALQLKHGELHHAYV